VIAQVQRPYAFDTGSTYAQAHHQAVAALLNRFTQWRIQGPRPRRQALPRCRCGFGSIATWLASQLWEHGYVLATDLTPATFPRRSTWP
jgi:hypothetical protein